MRGTGDRVGSAAAVGYCAAVISAPFAGAYLVGQAVDGDRRYATKYVVQMEGRYDGVCV
jgi:hypothetical protein